MGLRAGLHALEEKKNLLPLLEIEPNFSVFHHESNVHYTYNALLTALLNGTECYVYTRGQYSPEYLNKRSSLHKSIKRRNFDEWEVSGL